MKNTYVLKHLKELYEKNGMVITASSLRRIFKKLINLLSVQKIT